MHFYNSSRFHVSLWPWVNIKVIQTEIILETLVIFSIIPSLNKSVHKYHTTGHLSSICHYIKFESNRPTDVRVHAYVLLFDAAIKTPLISLDSLNLFEKCDPDVQR